jgi:hypothetical protein
MLFKLVGGFDFLERNGFDGADARITSLSVSFTGFSPYFVT